MNANFYFVGKRKRAGGAFGDARQQLHVPVETCDIKGVANEFDAVVFIYDTDEELDVFKKLAQGLNNFCRRGNVINEFVKACDVVSRCEDQVCFVIEKIAGGFGNGEIKQGVFGGFRNGKKRVDWLPISICVVSCEVAHGILGKVDADWSYKAGEFVGGISALNDGGCNVEYYYVNIERQLYCVITEYIGGRCFVGRYNLEKDGFDFCRISIRDGASVSESGIGEKLIGRNEIGCSTACEVQKRERAWYLLEKEFSDNDSCRWYCYGVGQDEFSEESVRYLVRVAQDGILSAYRCDYNDWVHLDRHDEDFVRITTECARQEVHKILSVNDCRELINDINFRLYGGPMFSVKRNIRQETAGLSGDLFCSTNNVSVQVVKDKIEVSDLMPILWVDFRSGLRIIDDVAMSCDKTETVIDLNAGHRSRAKHCTRLGN